MPSQLTDILRRIGPADASSIAYELDPRYTPDDVDAIIDELYQLELQGEVTLRYSSSDQITIWEAADAEGGA